MLPAAGWRLPPTLETMGYLGLPVLVLIVVGLLRYRRDGVLRLAAFVGLVSLVASMGDRLLVVAPRSLLAPPETVPLPTALLARAALVTEIAPVRFALLTAMFAGLAVAIVLDRLRSAAGGAEPWRWRSALAVAGVALVVAMLPLWTSAFPARPLATPVAYRAPAVAAYPVGSILLGYPLTTNFTTDALAWQAVERYRYRIVGGSAYVPGPGGRPTLGLPVSPLTVLFAAAAIGRFPSPIGAPTDRAVRAQLRSLGVDEIVVLRVGGDPVGLARWLGSMLGERPSIVGGAFVFTSVRRAVG